MVNTRIEQTQSVVQHIVWCPSFHPRSQRGMGICCSTRSKPYGRTKGNPYKWTPFLDDYESVEEVQKGLLEAGLEGSQLILGLDFTKSNEWTGKKTFQGLPLHSLQLGANQYTDVISVVAQVLSSFDDDRLIPCYGFGDVSTAAKKVFSFLPGNQPLYGLTSVVGRYRQVAPNVDMSGPTSFAPVILQAIRTVVESGMTYHVLVIIADGQVSPACQDATMDAIVLASNYPLSIVLVGVGDGPWDKMKDWDDKLPRRKFDNFQFVDFSSLMAGAMAGGGEAQLAQFALHAMMELPGQYKAITQLGMFGKQLPLPPGSKGLVVDPPPRVPPLEQTSGMPNLMSHG